MSAIFDLHARLPPGPEALDRLLRSMDDNGIERAAVGPGGVIDVDLLSRMVVEGGGVDTDPDNDALLAACDKAGGRLIPFYFANPYRDPGHYRAIAREVRGVEISPAVHGVSLTDERITAIVEIAAEFGHPVYTVCLGRPGTRSSDLVSLAAKFPAVTFILGHCGFIGIDTHAVTVVGPRPNIVAETSGCYTVLARIAVERLGDDRVLFGTDYPAQHPSVELAKMRALGLSPDSWRKVTGDNARRLLGAGEGGLG